MSDELSPTLILAVPGTQDTRELRRTAVLKGIQCGEIAPDQWVWSPSHNDWKTVAELPELQVPATAAEPIPSNPAHVSEPEQDVSPEPLDSEPSAHNAAPTFYSQPMQIKHEFPIFKVLFFILFLALAGIVAANYFKVDKPFATNLAATPFAQIPAYAHLGAFAQPGALVIHIPPNVAITTDNFADFLATLAQSTPPQPFGNKPFDGVGITSSWQSQYLCSGTDWQTLGKMTDATSEDRKKFEIEHLSQIDGSPLVIIRRNEDPAAVTDSENKAWQTLVANFRPK